MSYVARSDVRKFAKLLYQQLKEDFWGAIEPETFGNIAQSDDLEDRGTLMFDKISADEASEGSVAMAKYIEAALDGLK